MPKCAKICIVMVSSVCGIASQGVQTMKRNRFYSENKLGVWNRWNGMVEWNAGMEWWNGMVEWNNLIAVKLTYPDSFS